MSMLTWRFTALDSWFFKESRPFDTIGGSELNSVFPPSPATMAGAIRSAIGNHHNIDWKNYPQEYTKLHKQIGDSESLGKMSIKGIFLSKKNTGNNTWERLYPVPAHLVATHEQAKLKELHFLQVGKPVHCDLGKRVCLAVSATRGIKALEDYWLTQSGLAKVLGGKTDLAVKKDKIEQYDLIHSAKLFTNEPRLGIARNNQNRTVVQGNLYQTQHIRPQNGLAIEVDVGGLDASNYTLTGIMRLGGEGRGTAFEVFAANNCLPKIEFPETETLGIKLVLLSAMPMPQHNAKETQQKKTYTPLSGFEQSEEQGKTVWRGKINGIDLTLHCAVVGKVLREGGWDLIYKKPKPVRSLIPAGSVFYCTVNGDIKAAIDELRTAQLDCNPLDTALGRGLITVAPWFKHDSIATKENQS